jgi:hypothetical protein
MLRRSFLAALAAPLAPRVAGAQPAAKVHPVPPSLRLRAGHVIE